MPIDTLTDWGNASKIYNKERTQPATYNIPVYAGTSWQYTIDFRNGSLAPIPLTGYTFTLTIKRNEYDTATTKTLTIGSGITITGDNSSVLDINTIINFKSGLYVYDLIGTEPGGKIVPYLKGKLKVEEKV